MKERDCSTFALRTKNILGIRTFDKCCKQQVSGYYHGGTPVLAMSATHQLFSSWAVITPNGALLHASYLQNIVTCCVLPVPIVPNTPLTVVRQHSDFCSVPNMVGAMVSPSLAGW